VWTFAAHGESPTAARDRVQRESLADARRALAAADAITFSEAAIERAAKLLCAANNLGLDYWEGYHEFSLIKEKFRDQARAVVAALREET
jgi:hypothetical protein